MEPLDIAAQVFVECRTLHFWEYMQGRGLRQEWLDRMKIGYYPDHDVLDRPARIRSHLEEIGLYLKNGDALRMYQERFSFPIIVKGQVVSFAFRQSPYAQQSQSNPARMRSRHMNLETRDELSFFPYRIYARPYPVDTGSTDEVTLVEGAIDALRCAQVGFPTPIARLNSDFMGVIDGLRTNPESVGLDRPPKAVGLFLDWDATGQTTLLQIAAALDIERPPFEVKIYTACGPKPDDSDPADLSDESLRLTLETETLSPRAYIERTMEFSLDLDDPWQERAVRRYLESLYASSR